jgi:DNA replication and repair protein RecF
LTELGLGGGELAYAPRADGDAEALREGLRERRDADLKLGRSSWGPHLDELKLNVNGRALRKYGSQGQQRAALLALLFAEREALLHARRVTPLLLLDDVMSELDPGRRELLVARLATGGQTLITAADEESLPPAARASMVRMPSPGVVDDGAADGGTAGDGEAGSGEEAA